VGAPRAARGAEGPDDPHRGVRAFFVPLLLALVSFVEILKSLYQAEQGRKSDNRIQDQDSNARILSIQLFILLILFSLS
jgi:hypothetical protein